MASATARFGVLHRVRASSLAIPAGIVALALIMGAVAVPAHPRTARRLLDRRGALGRHRVASADGHPVGPAPGRLAAAVLPDAARLDVDLRQRRGRDARLSVAFALLTIPAALWAGRSLSGWRAGWMAAIVAALHPFLTYYAQETRMYALATLLSLLAVTCFVHAFVLRDRGSWRRSRSSPCSSRSRTTGGCSSSSRRASRSSCSSPDRTSGAGSCSTRSWPTARSSSCTPRGSRRCCSSPPTPAAPWSTRTGAWTSSCPRCSRLFGGPRTGPLILLVGGIGLVALIFAGGSAAGPGSRAARRPRPRGAPGGRGAAAHHARRAARGLARLAGRAGLHDALLRRHRRAARCC